MKAITRYQVILLCWLFLMTGNLFSFTDTVNHPVMASRATFVKEINKPFTPGMRQASYGGFKSAKLARKESYNPFADVRVFDYLKENLIKRCAVVESVDNICQKATSGTIRSDVLWEFVIASDYFTLQLKYKF